MIAQLFEGRYLTGPADDEDLRGAAEMCGMIKDLTEAKDESGDTYEKGVSGTVNGARSFGVLMTDADGVKSTLWIAAEGEPYILNSAPPAAGRCGPLATPSRATCTSCPSSLRPRPRGPLHDRLPPGHGDRRDSARRPSPAPRTGGGGRSGGPGARSRGSPHSPANTATNTLPRAPGPVVVSQLSGAHYQHARGGFLKDSAEPPCFGAAGGILPDRSRRRTRGLPAYVPAVAWRAGQRR